MSDRDAQDSSRAPDDARERALDHDHDRAHRPIGVFDSGVGGLTVVRALRERLPNERLLYLGDTARVPYGTKSAESVRRYAAQATRQLVARGIKALVVACNTASAVALDVLRELHAPLPVLGVIEGGARAAVSASRIRHVAVLATEGTVRGHAYGEAIRRLDPAVRVDEISASLLVALAEEGWTDGALVDAIVQRVLEPLAAGAGSTPDCVVLGCTHFPLLADPIRRALPPAVKLIDSAGTTAALLHERLGETAMLRTGTGSPPIAFLATDDPERFARVGSAFLGLSIGAGDVERIDL